ncbi:hypothetical protein CsSME_00000551 [Camellia sinensis var. sinensis]
MCYVHKYYHGLVINEYHAHLPGANAVQGTIKMGLQSHDLPLVERTNQMHLLLMVLPTPTQIKISTVKIQQHEREHFYKFFIIIIILFYRHEREHLENQECIILLKS